MSDPILLHDVLLAGEGLTASVLLPILALIVASCFPKRAALRHLTWLSAFIGLLALPLMALVLPARIVIEQRVAPALAVSGVIAAPARMIASGPAIAAGVSAVLPTQLAAGKPVPAHVATPAPQPFGPAQLAIAAFALWLSGVAVILLYHTMALLGLGRLRRRSIPQAIADPELRGRWQLRIASPSGTYGPLTWGIWRPVILLPHHASSWPQERLASVLRHEIAHVRRHDMLAQMLAQLTCALYWPNPLVWLGARRLRREAEIAADDAVLFAGVRPSSYAETLMAMAAEFHRRSSGVAMAMPSTLEARITSVLTSTQTRTGVTVMDVFKTACLGSAVITLMVLARPDLVVAQQVSPTTPTASPVASAAVLPRVAMMQAASRLAAPQTIASATPKPAAITTSAVQVLAEPDANRSEAVLPATQTDQADSQAEAGPSSPAKVEGTLAAADAQPVVAVPVVATSPSAPARAPRSIAALNSPTGGWYLTSGLYADEHNYRAWTHRTTPSDLEAGVGTTAGMSGSQVAYVRGNDDLGLVPNYEGYGPQRSFMHHGGLERRISLQALRGKRIRLTLRLKNEGEARAYASVQIDKSNYTAIRAFSQWNEPGDDIWQPHQFVLDVPDNATDLAIDVGLTGKGTIWLDGVTLEQVGDQITVSGSHRVEFAGCENACVVHAYGPIAPMPGIVAGVGQRKDPVL